MARVTIEQASKHADFHLASMTNPIFPSYDLSNWVTASIGDVAIFWDILYRTDDDPVLYVFDVIDQNSEVLGYIGICGSTYFNSTLAFIRKISIASLEELLENRITQLASSLNIAQDQILPVAYSYPKIGLVALIDEQPKYVLDLFTGNQFDYREDIDTQEVQGSLAWSFWDTFPQAGISDRWENENNFIDSVISSPNPLQPLNLLDSGENFLFRASNFTEPLSQARKFIESQPPIVRTYVLPVPEICKSIGIPLGQETSILCAPTSLSLIYGYIYQEKLEQNDIAAIMQITPSGSTISGQRQAFEELFSEQFEIELDRDPSFEDIVTSIEKNQLPLKSGIRGHARVASGIQEQIFSNPITGKILLKNNLLYVNDPEPIGSGSNLWENVADARLTDFIILSRR